MPNTMLLLSAVVLVLCVFEIGRQS